MLCVGEEGCCSTSETGALRLHCTVYYCTHAGARVLRDSSVLVIMTPAPAMVCLGLMVLAFALNGRQTKHFYALKKWGLFSDCIGIYMMPERPYAASFDLNQPRIVKSNFNMAGGFVSPKSFGETKYRLKLP